MGRGEFQLANSTVRPEKHGGVARPPSSVRENSTSPKEEGDAPAGTLKWRESLKLGREGLKAKTVLQQKEDSWQLGPSMSG